MVKYLKLSQTFNSTLFLLSSNGELCISSPKNVSGIFGRWWNEALNEMKWKLFFICTSHAAKEELKQRVDNDLNNAFRLWLVYAIPLISLLRVWFIIYIKGMSRNSGENFLYFLLRISLNLDFSFSFDQKVFQLFWIMKNIA